MQPLALISRNQGVHLDLKDFLFGNVLGVADTDLLLTALVTGYVLLSVVVFYRYLFVSTFQPVVAETMGIPVHLIHYFLMLLLSFAVVASLQTVGVILVVAMLITPAATALLLSDKLKTALLIAAGIGLLSAITGLILAILLETTPGPAMAVMATIYYLITVLFAPKKGLLAKMYRRWQLRKRINREDILKAIYRSEQRSLPLADDLRERLEMSRIAWSSALRVLRRQGWLQKDRLSLSEKGESGAKRLVRAHRLWETYLATEVGLDKAHIHPDAERYEHLLSEEMLNEVDRKLGFPSVDPHGSPIPQRDKYPPFPLNRLKIGEKATLSDQQKGEEVIARLWQEQLQAGQLIEVRNRQEEQLTIICQQKEYQLPVRLAEQINVKPESTLVE